MPGDAGQQPSAASSAEAGPAALSPEVAALREERAEWASLAARLWAEAVTRTVAADEREAAMLARHELKLAELYKLLDELRESTSWRVTRPLRWVSGTLQALRRRP